MFFVVVVLITSNGCVSTPETDMFFMSKNYKPSAWNGMPSYPDGFIGLNNNHFSQADREFYMFYYNNFGTVGCNVRIFGPSGKFCGEDSQRLIQRGCYYYFKPNISELVKRDGYGKYEVKLCRNGEAIKALEFYIEK
jgi:hypothetical protein